MDKLTLDKWLDPDELAGAISSNYRGDIWTYLKSGQSNDIKGSKSIIALFPIDEVVNKDVDFLIKNKIKKDYSDNYDDSYLTLLPYEYSHNIEEKYPTSDRQFINFPTSIFVKFSLIYEFLYDLKQVNVYFQQKSQVKLVNEFFNRVSKGGLKKPEISNINSSFSQAEYRSAIEKIQDKIAKGICYQTNLTRKFFGSFTKKPADILAFKLFDELSEHGPANYSCFIKYYDKFILSNSPELYLKVSDNIVTSQPIKGTSPRSSNPIIDYYNKKYLTFSGKEKAENLMIVDLVRNDLSLFSKAGSVLVDRLFRTDSYKSYHHLSTIVKSRLLDDKNLSDIIRASFPPASMTGTPKISAVNVANDLERMKRGIYSGAIGFINGRKNANLSVVIRTLIVENDKFEFQVGGAITTDSNPDKEIEETYVKAKGICKILGIKNLKNIGKLP